MQSTTLIGFTEDATAGIDNGFDSRRLATAVSLYSHLENGTGEFGIQSREAFNVNSVVPIGFSTQIEVDEGLPYVISIADMAGPSIETAAVYLVDTYLGIITNLTESTYQFTAPSGTFDNRFRLQFKPELLGTLDASLAAISLYPNPTSEKIEIHAPNNVMLQEAVIYDISGRLLMQINLEELEGLHTIDVSAFSNATYFIQLKTLEGAITKQFVKE